MEKQVKELILDYQKIIANLDKKLAVYEQLGSPEEIAESLKKELAPVQESNLENISVKRVNKLLEAKKSKIIEEKKEENKTKEINSVIESFPSVKKNVIEDMKSLLSKFKTEE